MRWATAQNHTASALTMIGYLLAECKVRCHRTGLGLRKFAQNKSASADRIPPATKRKGENLLTQRRKIGAVNLYSTSGFTTRTVP
jgi:hypothetical protein